MIISNMNELTILGEDLMKNKAKLREVEIRLEAIMNLLEKEGILIKQEVEQEFNELIKNINSG